MLDRDKKQNNQTEHQQRYQIVHHAKGMRSAHILSMIIHTPCTLCAHYDPLKNESIKQTFVEIMKLRRRKKKKK